MVCSNVAGRCVVDHPHQLFDRPPDQRFGMALVGLDVEARLVRRQRAALITKAPRAAEHVVVFEQVAVVLDVVADAAEHAAHHRLVHGFDEGVKARVPAVHEQARVRFARRRNPQPREEPHRHGFLDAAEILRQVVEHERLEAEKLLAARVTIEVDAKAGLGGAPRSETARANADVAHGLPVPDQVGRVIGVFLEGGLELRPVGLVEPQLDALQHLRIEEIVLRLRQRAAR